MEEKISIAGTEGIEFIYDKLKRDFDFLYQRGIDIDIVPKNCGEYEILECFIYTKPASDCCEDKSNIFEDDKIMLCKYYISNAVSELILNRWQAKIIKKIIYNGYNLFDASEKKRIYSLSEEILNENAAADGNTLNEKNKIFDKVSSFLETSSKINVDGFIDFRLKDYKTGMKKVVEEAIDEYFLEKEYDDFIELLKYFVDMQKPLIEKVHVLLNPEGDFYLFDRNFNMLDNELVDEVIINQGNEELTCEDLLISSLITMAPVEVIIHLAGNEADPSVATIEKIFDSKITFCTGCEKCLYEQQREF